MNLGTAAIRGIKVPENEKRDWFVKNSVDLGLTLSWAITLVKGLTTKQELLRETGVSATSLAKWDQGQSLPSPRSWKKLQTGIEYSDLEARQNSLPKPPEDPSIQYLPTDSPTAYPKADPIPQAPPVAPQNPEQDAVATAMTHGYEVPKNEDADDWDVL